MSNITIIKSIELIKESDCKQHLAGMPSVERDALLRSGASFTPISDLLPELSSFIEDEKSGDAGVCFERKIVFELARVGVDTPQLDPFSGRMVAAIVTDGNNVSHFVSGLRLTRKRQITGKVKGKNTTVVTLAGRGLAPSPVVI